MKTLATKIFSILVILTACPLSFADGFFIQIPIGLETFNSSHINPAITTEGFDAVTDITSSDYSGGFGYEWGSGFTLAVKGGRAVPVDESLTSTFLLFDVVRGGLSIDAPMIVSGMHRFTGGLCLGAKISRWTAFGSTYQGVAQNVSAFVEPSLSYQYGANSVRFFVEASFGFDLGGEFKTFGTPGVSQLKSDNANAALGLKIFL